jgi:hypothetical protein
MAPLPTSRDELAGARREGAQRKRWRGGSPLALSLRGKEPFPYERRKQGAKANRFRLYQSSLTKC